MSYPQLTRIRIAGFRSLRDLTLELRPVTVLIGPNGSGKSNLLSALRMIAMMRTGALRVFVGDQGAASTLLHYGPSKTRELEVELDFATAEDKQNGYKARLGYARATASFSLTSIAGTRKRVARRESMRPWARAMPSLGWARKNQKAPKPRKTP